MIRPDRGRGASSSVFGETPDLFALGGEAPYFRLRVCSFGSPVDQSARSSAERPLCLLPPIALPLDLVATMSDFDPTDAYLTLAGHGESELTVDRSQFLGEALPVGSEQEAEEYVEQVRDEHYDARHVCYGLRVGRGGQRIDRSNDDGEPPRTGGFPIWQVLDGEDLTNCLCLVVRYYGGVKLGTGGLTRAYRKAARGAVDDAGIVERFPEETFEVSIPYDRFDEIEHFLETHDHARIQGTDYGADVAVEIGVWTKHLESFREELGGKLGKEL